MYFPPHLMMRTNSHRRYCAAEKRIAVDASDAEQFCCNAVDLNRQVFLNGASDSLKARLRQAGFTPVITHCRVHESRWRGQVLTLN